MPKPKKLAYRLIPEPHPLYDLLEELVGKYHEELSEAHIALAWNLTWKPDVDGRCTLGKCKKASDLDRELARCIGCGNTISKNSARLSIGTGCGNTT